MTFKAFQSSSWKAHLQPSYSLLCNDQQLWSLSARHFLLFSNLKNSAAKSQFIQWAATSSVVPVKAHLKVQIILVLENRSHLIQNILTWYSWAYFPGVLAWRFRREKQDTQCWQGGWDLDWMWLYSVKPARRGRWTLTETEVAMGRVDEVERIADWQLSSITCPTSQIQVDRKGDVGENGDSYTVYRRCLFASRPPAEYCLLLICLTIYQSILFQGQAHVWHAPFNSAITELCGCFIYVFFFQQAVFTWEWRTIIVQNTSEFTMKKQIIFVTYLSLCWRWLKLLE